MKADYDVNDSDLKIQESHSLDPILNKQTPRTL